MVYINGCWVSYLVFLLQLLQEQLHQKEDEIDQLKDLGVSMIENRHGKPSPEGNVIIQGMIDELSEKCSSLSHEVWANVYYDSLFMWVLLEGNGC